MIQEGDVDGGDLLGKSDEVSFGGLSEKAVGVIARILDALKTLPVREMTLTMRLRGSSSLRYDLSRRLR